MFRAWLIRRYISFDISATVHTFFGNDPKNVVIKHVFIPEFLHCVGQQIGRCGSGSG